VIIGCKTSVKEFCGRLLQEITGVYNNMDKWIELRRKIRNQDISLRQISREDGIHRQTLRKIRDNSQPPGYQRTKPIVKLKIDPYIDRIKAIIKQDDGADHKKQYYTDPDY